ncbi:MAG TPA: hypothetical protein VFK94_06260, partial [Patescibacteria group bacterium]|nr:hypothetical protein [Patescibacteria group bacterium]
KSLPGRVRELEQDAERKDLALKRQAEELELWKGVATQTPEIKKVLELFQRHERLADHRHKELDRQHTTILNLLIKLEAYIAEREEK